MPAPRQLGHHRRVHLVRIARGVDHPHPLGVAARDLLVALGDAALQLHPLALEAVGGPALGRDPLGRDLGVQPQQQRHVGPEPAGRQVAELLDPLGAEPPRRRPGRRRWSRRSGRRPRRGRPRSPAGSPRRRAGRAPRRTAAARPSGRARTSPSLSRSRIFSPAAVPPGSRTSSVSGPSASARRAACVVLPEPSTPSSAMNTPSGYGLARLPPDLAGFLAAALPLAPFLALRARFTLVAEAWPAIFSASAASSGRPSSVGLGRRLGLRAVRALFRLGGLLRGLLGLLRRLALGALALHLLHRGAVVVEAELPGPARLELLVTETRGVRPQTVQMSSSLCTS